MNWRRAALLVAGGWGCAPAVPGPAAIAGPAIEEQQSGTTALLIAVHAVSDEVAWASGVRGTFVRTTDGGRHWETGQVAGADHLQFRDVHALDAKTAWLLSIGPADSSRIYQTRDGGRSWSLQFTNRVATAFFDCFDFWDARHALAISDAVGRETVMVETRDGGTTWTAIPASRLPAALPGEGSLAASGTCLAVRAGGLAWAAVTGATARVLHSADFGASWRVDTVPLSTIASVAFRDDRHGIVLGSDTTAATATSADGGRNWRRGGPPPFPRGIYGGAWVPGARAPVVVAAGPGGLAFSRDEGASWTLLNRNAYWGVGFAPTGAGWAVGPGGRITRLARF